MSCQAAAAGGSCEQFALPLAVQSVCSGQTEEFTAQPAVALISAGQRRIRRYWRHCHTSASQFSLRAVHSLHHVLISDEKYLNRDVKHVYFVLNFLYSVHN